MKVSDNITIENIDCMDLMASYKDKHFDLAIVDPPYGIKQDGHRENNRSKAAKSTEFHKALWDQQRPTSEYFAELFRVSKNQVIWGGNHLSDLINKYSPCWLVWDKHTTGGFADCELAFTSFSTAVRKFDYPWNGMIQGFHGSKSKNEKRIHPTQKPIKLYEWILSNYATEGNSILDTHLGSASIAAAVHNMNTIEKMGLKFVGSEIDKTYFEAAEIRLKKHVRQMTIFDL